MALAGPRSLAAYAYGVFPDLMLDFYPWGLSVNIVQPRGIARTRVLLRSCVWDAEKLGDGAGNGLDQVEMEREEVVQHKEFELDRKRPPPFVESAQSVLHTRK